MTGFVSTIDNRGQWGQVYFHVTLMDLLTGSYIPDIPHFGRMSPGR
jgi:hypothetical protein